MHSVGRELMFLQTIDFLRFRPAIILDLNILLTSIDSDPNLKLLNQIWSWHSAGRQAGHFFSLPRLPQSGELLHLVSLFLSKSSPLFTPVQYYETGLNGQLL